MNCFACHSQAKPEFDLVCERDHGCAPIPANGRADLQRPIPRRLTGAQGDQRAHATIRARRLWLEYVRHVRGAAFHASDRLVRTQFTKTRGSRRGRNSAPIVGLAANVPRLPYLISLRTASSPLVMAHLPS